MAFQKGHKLATGRPKGSENEATKQFKTVREVVLSTFHKLQDNPKVNLEQFAIDNPREFYAIAAKLIPTEIKADVLVVKAVLPPFMLSNEPKTES